ncbi:hypothetical protein C1H46_025277 [Malus baccata]|uniref:Uncharacterized protein n=1 Tax=Malus baccata TaxID=106549 RepID=A0A540LRR6_MALBA|nr:hypothetical protein C1H46_025277 [Malus baccata]
MATPTEETIAAPIQDKMPSPIEEPMGARIEEPWQLINQMLKIPEQTFSDHDSQVQIASQLFENAQRWSYHFGFHNSSMPYLSLLHGKLTEEEKKKAGEIVNILDESMTSLTFAVTHFALYEIDYDDKSLKSWTKIAEIGR